MRALLAFAVFAIVDCRLSTLESQIHQIPANSIVSAKKRPLLKLKTQRTKKSRSVIGEQNFSAVVTSFDGQFWSSAPRVSEQLRLIPNCFIEYDSHNKIFICSQRQNLQHHTPILTCTKGGCNVYDDKPRSGFSVYAVDAKIRKVQVAVAVDKETSSVIQNKNFAVIWGFTQQELVLVVSTDRAVVMDLLVQYTEEGVEVNRTLAGCFRCKYVPSYTYGGRAPILFKQNLHVKRDHFLQRFHVVDLGSTDLEKFVVAGVHHSSERMLDLGTDGSGAYSLVGAGEALTRSLLGLSGKPHFAAPTTVTYEGQMLRRSVIELTRSCCLQASKLQDMPNCSSCVDATDVLQCSPIHGCKKLPERRGFLTRRQSLHTRAQRSTREEWFVVKVEKGTSYSFEEEVVLAVGGTGGTNAKKKYLTKKYLMLQDDQNIKVKILLNPINMPYDNHITLIGPDDILSPAVIRCCHFCKKVPLYHINDDGHEPAVIEFVEMVDYPIRTSELHLKYNSSMYVDTYLSFDPVRTSFVRPAINSPTALFKSNKHIQIVENFLFLDGKITFRFDDVWLDANAVLRRKLAN